MKNNESEESYSELLKSNKHLKKKMKKMKLTMDNQASEIKRLRAKIKGKN